jgi:hypothetical protein
VASCTPATGRPLRGWHFAPPLDVVPPTSPPEPVTILLLDFRNGLCYDTGMATVTVTIRLRRTEGRSPVDIEDLAAALIEELESSVLDTEFAVTDSSGEDASYEVTNVTARRTGPPAPDSAEPDHQCPQCGAAVHSADGGRPRIYDTDACRQAAYRARRPAN